VKLEAIKPWISEKIVSILGFEDDIVIGYVMEMLVETVK
jgi:hypothetical protein